MSNCLRKFKDYMPLGFGDRKADQQSLVLLMILAAVGFIQMFWLLI